MKTKSFSKLVLSMLLLSSVLSCADDTSTPDPSPNPDSGQIGRKFFNITLSTSVNDNTETYAQSLSDLSTGEVTFKGYGYEVPSTRTARVSGSSDGSTLYSLDYGGGTISKFSTLGGQSYDRTNHITFSHVFGTEYVRWTVANDDNVLLHNVNTKEIVTNDDGSYSHHKSIATIMNISLDEFLLGEAVNHVLPRVDAADSHLYVSRIDAPAISNGKAYYGLSMKKYNPVTGEDFSSSEFTYPATTLMVDYPSLKNPKLIQSEFATGSTYGYRIPVAHKIENGDVYQLTAYPSYILKLKGDKYDASYKFNLSTALGRDIGTQGWFYVGDGIGYATYYDKAKGNSSDAAAWGIVRVDIHNKTVVMMNTPKGLYLSQYQNAAIGNDGKLYMALAPVGADGSVHIFDPENASPDGFTTGAKLKSYAGASYIGIY